MALDVPLLITGTVDPRGTRHVAIADRETRRFEYACSLVAWLQTPDVATVVFCENSNTDWDFGALRDFAAAQGKTLETLVFEGDAARAAQRGKGWGEGEITRHALRHSAHLKGAFYKCSGRAWVVNFAEIRAAHRSDRAVFQSGNWGAPVRSLPFPLQVARSLRWRRVARQVGARDFHPNRAVSTLFYKCEAAFWDAHLSRAFEQVRDDAGFYFEHAIEGALRGTGFMPLRVAPVVAGRSGSTGRGREGGDFTPEVQRLAREML